MEYRKRLRERGKFSLEFKKQVLKEYYDGVDGIRGLGRRHGISHQLIASWLKRSQDPERQYRLGDRAKEVTVRLKALPEFTDNEKELEFLRTENAYLKEMLQICGYARPGRKKKDSEPLSDFLPRGTT